jgi:hypothetical protein
MSDAAYPSESYAKKNGVPEDTPKIPALGNSNGAAPSSRPYA